MQFLPAIINSGIQYSTAPSVKRGLQLSNTIALILFGLGLVVGVTHYLWFGWGLHTYLIPAAGLTALLVVILNSTGIIYTSRIWLSLGPAILIMFLSIYAKSLNYDNAQRLDYYTFRMVILGTSVIPWVVFSLKEKSLLIGCSILCLLILLAHDPLHGLFGVPYRQAMLHTHNYYFMNVIIFITYTLVTGSLGFLKWVSDKNEDRNIELIADLADANRNLMERNSEIETQSTQILAQSEVVLMSQNKLIEANNLIEDQRKQLITANQSLQSELIEKNADLTETNSELIKHNNELRQFSYTVSHNLRGPVASLLGLISLIDLSSIQEKDQEAFSHLISASHQLDQIIKDISKIIDIRHDIFKIRQRIDLEAEISDVSQVLRRELETHGVTIGRKLNACQHIYSIKPMVNSILYNLISNGIKYRSNERQPVIEVSTLEDDDFYYISVLDNGLGIDLKQNKDSLFKLYKRFHFHTEGKGLGLFLVKLQSESLGGTVEIDSEINRYTRFTVKLKKPINIDRQVLYQESYAEIFYDARVNATGVIWKSAVTSDQYRAVFRKCLEFVRSYNTPNYIADMRLQGPIQSADQLWMFQEILPQAICNGLKRIAGITGNLDDPLVTQYLDSINENIEKLGAVQKFFASREHAFEWLQHENQLASVSRDQ